MHCPKCHSPVTKVINTRPSDDSRGINMRWTAFNAALRRRQCIACRFRFTTVELTEMTIMKIVRDSSFSSKVGVGVRVPNQSGLVTWGKKP
jgi:transcriptional repressor NrdR